MTRRAGNKIQPRLAPSRDADVGGSAGAPFRHRRPNVVDYLDAKDKKQKGLLSRVCHFLTIFEAYAVQQ